MPPPHLSDFPPVILPLYLISVVLNMISKSMHPHVISSSYSVLRPCSSLSVRSITLLHIFSLYCSLCSLFCASNSQILSTILLLVFRYTFFAKLLLAAILSVTQSSILSALPSCISCVMLWFWSVLLCITVLFVIYPSYTRYTRSPSFIFAPLQLPSSIIVILYSFFPTFSGWFAKGAHLLSFQLDVLGFLPYHCQLSYCHPDNRSIFSALFILPLLMSCFFSAFLFP